MNVVEQKIVLVVRIAIFLSFARKSFTVNRRRFVYRRASDSENVLRSHPLALSRKLRVHPVYTCSSYTK